MRFNYRKATQVLNWLARRNGGRIGKLRAMKLVFFADRLHLRQHGRMITEDSYVAMQYGPVPEGTKDIAGLTEFLNPDEREYAGQYLRPIGGREIGSLRSVDADVLSQTDQEALEAVWRRFGDGRADLVKVSHRFPEWSELASRVGNGGRASIPAEAFLQDCGPAAEPFELARLDAEARELLKAELRESMAIRHALSG